LARRIAGWRADIVLLQEAPPEAVVRDLARQAGMHAAFWSTRGPAGAQWPFGFPGAVLSRFPITEAQDRAAALRTPGDARFHRHWGDALVAVPGAPLRVAGFHLCADWGGVFREEVRLAELDAFVQAPLPDLLAGDFNTRPGEVPVRRLREAGWRDTWLESAASGDGLTSDTRRRIQRIDYLWLAPKAPWRATAAEVLADPAFTVDGIEVLLSDHHPVLAVLRPGG
jgi:endonuclease/exonuclease/phosphatase family metal-dependent hydrolase